MNQDMTKGNITRHLIMFALPLLFSNIFQQFYNVADTAIIGHMLGDNALSAVGSVSSLYGLATSVVFGMTNGFAVMVSRYYGAHDYKRMKNAIAATIIYSLGIALALSLVFLVLLKPVMHLINTPESVFDEGYSYIVVILACMVVTAFYNMWASILRAVGNTVMPLVFLVISSVLNIVLDITFIGAFHLGVQGAALATIISQAISGIACFIYVIKGNPELVVAKGDFKFEKGFIGDMLMSGLSLSLMYAVVNLGSVILQSGINGLGANTIAAHVSARKISEVYMTPISIISQTLITFSAQNYGAGNLKRVKQGVDKGFMIGFIWATTIIIFTYIFADNLISGLTGSENAEIIKTGAKYLKINLPFYYPLVVLCALRSTLQAIGSKLLPVIASVLELLGKVIVVIFFVKPFGYTAICFCEPATWIVCCIPVVYAFYKYCISKLKNEKK